MTTVELEASIARLREQPLTVLCVTTTGKARIMTIKECVETGSEFVHVVCNELDKLLETELPRVERRLENV